MGVVIVVELVFDRATKGYERQGQSHDQHNLIGWEGSLRVNLSTLYLKLVFQVRG